MNAVEARKEGNEQLAGNLNQMLLGELGLSANNVHYIAVKA